MRAVLFRSDGGHYRRREALDPQRQQRGRQASEAARRRRNGVIFRWSCASRPARKRGARRRSDGGEDLRMYCRRVWPASGRGCEHAEPDATQERSEATGCRSTHNQKICRTVRWRLREVEVTGEPDPQRYRARRHWQFGGSNRECPGRWRAAPGRKALARAYHPASIKEGEVEGQRPALVNLTMPPIALFEPPAGGFGVAGSGGGGRSLG